MPTRPRTFKPDTGVTTWDEGVRVPFRHLTAGDETLSKTARLGTHKKIDWRVSLKTKKRTSGEGGGQTGP